MSKQSKPEVSIDNIKQIVKKVKKVGYDQLSHHQMAVALTTIGFREVCKQFGAEWNEKIEKEIEGVLKSSQYEVSWISKSNNPNYIPFLQLCSRGDIEKVKQFINTVGKGRQEFLETVDNFKRTALHLAVKEGFDVLTEYLIKEGFSVNARDRQLKTPLHYCKSQLICQILLKKGCNVIARDNKNCTSAHYAASGSQFKVLQMMLKKINVVNELDSTLKSPLFYAIYNSSDQQVNILRVLLQNGAKINIQDLYGKTALHYAAEMSKSRCIPYLLQKGAKIDIVDKHNKTPLDLASNEKIKKIITAYSEGKGDVLEKEEKQKRQQFSKIVSQNSKQNQSKIDKQAQSSLKRSSGQAYTKQVNQVATWVREKIFVLMKKLQQSGIKSLWHLKRPYIYTGSWAEDIQGLQDLYETFLNVSGPESAMRVFNILCPYEKALPTVMGKSQQAFQSFFGQNWFSNDPIEKIRNMHSQTKIRSELELKIKQAEDLKTELLCYKSQIEKLEGTVQGLREQLNHYQKIEEDLRKQRTKNTQQYAESLKYLNQISNLKEQIEKFSNGEQKTKILSTMIEELRSKNQDLINQISTIRVNQAAARRKCGQIFLKSLAMAAKGQNISQEDEANLYDDDAILSLYQLLKSNPPNLEKRFKLADRRGTGKLNIEEFTKLLQTISMLPQDVMSMHRITGFAFGRKTLSLEQFKTILENRHKNRPMWQKQLIRKIKNILLAQNISLDKFFNILDVDGSGTIQPSQLRKGLEDFNIFMNQSDWSNLFNLLDSDKSGTIELEELKNLLKQESTGKLDELPSMIKNSDKKEKEVEQEQKDDQQIQKQDKQGEQQQNQSNRNQQEQQGQRQQDQKSHEQQEEKQDEEQKEEVKSRSQNKLLSEQSQFKQEYQEEDSEVEAGIEKLNGEIKLQVPLLRLNQQNHPQKVHLKFVIGDLEMIKMADLSLPKLTVALKFEMIDYKVFQKSDLKLFLSAYEANPDRSYTDDDFLGEVQIELQNIFAMPTKWGINKQYNLSKGDKQTNEGKIVLQAKWIPQQEE